MPTVLDQVLAERGVKPKPTPLEPDPQTMLGRVLREREEEAKPPKPAPAAPPFRQPESPLPAGLAAGAEPQTIDREPTASELQFFRENPTVAGYASDDNRVVINPLWSEGKSTEAIASVRRNEHARIVMRQQNLKPTFALTPRQRTAFADYGSEDDIRETIVGRIIGEDQSAEDVTEEQAAFAKQVMQHMAAGAEPSLEPDDTKGFFESLGHGLARGTVETARAAIEATPRIAAEQIETLARAAPGGAGAMAALQMLRDFGVEVPDEGALLRQGIEKVYNVGFNKWVADKMAEIKEAHPEWEPQRLATIEDLLNNPMALVEQIAATVPYMGGSLVAHAIGGPGLAFQFAYAVEGQHAYEEAIRTGATREQAEAQAQIVGGINGLIEVLQIRHAIKFAKGAKRPLIDAAVALVRRKVGEKGLLTAGAKIAKSAIGLALGEGVEEVLQGTTEELAARGIQGREIPEGFFERRAIEGIIGGLAGLIFGVGGRAAVGVARRVEAARAKPPAAPEAPAEPAPPAAPAEAPPVEAAAPARPEAEPAPSPVEVAPAVPVEPTAPPAEAVPKRIHQELGAGVYASTNREIAESYAAGRGPLALEERARTGREVVTEFYLPAEAKVFTRDDTETPGLLQEMQTNTRFAEVWADNYADADPTNDNIWAAAQEAHILPDLQSHLEGQGYRAARHRTYGREQWDYAIWDESAMSPEGPGVLLYRGGEPAVEAPPVEAPPTVEAPPVADKKQLARGHILARELGLTDEKRVPTDEYRSIARDITGKDSMAEMTPDEADRFIRALEERRTPESKKRGAVQDYDRAVSKLKKKYGKAFETAHPIYRDAFRALTDPIAPKMPKKKRARLKATRTFIDVHPEVLDPSHPDHMPKHVLKALSTLTKVPATEMSLEDIQAATNGLKHMAKLHELRRDLLEKRKEKGLGKVKAGVMSELPPPKTLPSGAADIPHVGAVRKKAQFIGTNLRLRLQRLGKTMEQFGMMGQQHSTETAIQAQEELADAWNEIAAKHGVDPDALSKRSETLSGRTELVKTALPSGGTVAMAADRRAAFDLIARQPDGRKGLKAGKGLVYFVKKVGTYRQVDHEARLTDADIDAIIASMTEQERALAETMSEWLNGPAKQMLNERYSMPMFDYEVATRPGYFPFRRHGADVKHVIPFEEALLNMPYEYFGKGSMEQWDALKPRVVGARARLEIPSGLAVISEHIKRISALVGYAEHLRNTETLLRDPEVRRVIDGKWGSGETDAILKALRQSAGREARVATFDVFLAKQRGRFTRAKLAARISSWAAQLCSAPLTFNATTGAEAQEFAELVAGPLTPADTAQAEEVMTLENAPILWRRLKKGFIGYEMTDIMRQGEMEQVFTGKRPVGEKAMVGLRIPDKRVILRIALAARRAAERAAPEGTSEADILRQAGERATEITAWTQPTGDAMDRTPSALSKSEYWRGLTMFRAFLDKVLIQTNKSISDYTNIPKGQRTKGDLVKCIGRLVNAWVVMAGLNWLRKEMFRVLRRKEPHREKTWGNFAVDIIGQMASFLPFGQATFETLRQSVEQGAWPHETIDWFDQPFLNTAKNFLQGIGGLAGAIYSRSDIIAEKGNEAWIKKLNQAIQKSVESTSTLTGVPTESLIDIYESVERWVAGEDETVEGVTRTRSPPRTRP